MGHKIVLLMIMLGCFVNYSHTHSEDGLCDHHLHNHIASGLTSLQSHSGSEDFVSNGGNMLEEGHRSPLWRDVQVLLSFKKDIKDRAGKLSNWTTENWEEACSWYGITCRKNTQRVVAIVLPGLNLTGTLSPSIGSLSLLHTLNLSYHNLTGQIPPEIGQLKALRVLDLTFNHMLTEHIPESLTSNYMLTGSIPKSLSNCTRLRRISLAYNFFVGSIPKSLSNCTSLQFIDFAANNFIGTIPTEFGRLVMLEQLYLIGNSLTGRIPPTLGNCTKLLILMLSFNNFTGSIPIEFGHLVELEYLSCEYSLLSGHIPPTLGHCSKLQVLYLSNNFLSGHIPPTLGNCTKLQNLQMSKNLLSGNIPGSILGNTTSLLYSVDLSENYLEGLMPTLHKCGSLVHFDVSKNSFSGDLDLGFPVFLVTFSAHSNKFFGPLHTYLVNCTQLQLLDLRRVRYLVTLHLFTSYKF